MDEIVITNCHIHTFTTAHTPRYFPGWFAVIFRLVPGAIRFLRWCASVLPDRWYSKVVRLENFHRTGSRETQEDVFREVRRYFPSETRFVVLPMDMELIGFGPVEQSIAVQHDELARLRDRFPDQAIPFATIYPDRTAADEGGVDGVAEFRRAIDTLGFRGLKLYTKLGYRPDHPRLMAEVYPHLQEKGLPVLAHCSRGGVHHKGWDQARQDEVTAPFAWKPVLERFPGLRLCLAHYGGDTDWRNILIDGFDPDRPEEKLKNWVYQINQMLTEHDNLFTDISYTLFKFSEYSSLLQLFLKDSCIRERVLFGSDFYMNRQEALSEKALSLNLRSALGEDLFRQIAQENPARFLGP